MRLGAAVTAAFLTTCRIVFQKRRFVGVLCADQCVEARLLIFCHPCQAVLVAVVFAPLAPVSFLWLDKVAAVASTGPLRTATPDHGLNSLADGLLFSTPADPGWEYLWWCVVLGVFVLAEERILSTVLNPVREKHQRLLVLEGA